MFLTPCVAFQGSCVIPCPLVDLVSCCLDLEESRRDLALVVHQPSDHVEHRRILRDLVEAHSRGVHPSDRPLSHYPLAPSGPTASATWIASRQTPQRQPSVIAAPHEMQHPAFAVGASARVRRGMANRPDAIHKWICCSNTWA